MKTTRQRLWEYLQTRRAASAAELARALHMTSANVRHHLAILAEEGVVEVVGEQRSAGRGRPTRFYGLTGQATQNNLDGLASALLLELRDRLPPEEFAGMLHKVAGRLSLDDGTRGGKGLVQRLFRAVNRLNEMNYQARWEARADAPRVILGHCPYAAILPEHPELCQLDALILEKMLGASATQVARLALDPQGMPHCVFAITAP
ncbi:MAG: ArsR family transcriptional regulator [Chloroflexota bacterium]|nr:MAG: ArsR family transcriptional regulator [Chloroflexota bacterium]